MEQSVNDKKHSMSFQEKSFANDLWMIRYVYETCDDIDIILQRKR